jgi:hypothetical protein
METKKYSSFSEIERDLEILKLEKEINYQKLHLSIQKTKDGLTPKNIVTDLLCSATSIASNPFWIGLKVGIPFIISTVFPFIKKWFANKKRGN